MQIRGFQDTLSCIWNPPNQLLNVELSEHDIKLQSRTLDRLDKHE